MCLESSNGESVIRSTPRVRGRSIAAAAAAAICALASGTASAHIVLPCIGDAGAPIICSYFDAGPDVPQDWLVPSDENADPLKSPPCDLVGTTNSDTTSTQQSNVVTTYQAGQTITVVWKEIISHPGYFRIAFAPYSPAEVAADTAANSGPANGAIPLPTGVTPEGGSISPNGGIVLADYLFPHSGTPNVTYLNPVSYSAQVTLPTTPCASCTLQVLQLEFPLLDPEAGPPTPLDLSGLYVHCAAISITTPSATDGGAGSSSDASSGPVASSGSTASATKLADSGVSGSAQPGSGSGSASGSLASAQGGVAASSRGSGGAGNGKSGGCDISPGPAAFPAIFAAAAYAMARRRRRRR